MENLELLAALKADIEKTVSTAPEAEWRRFANQATGLSVKRNRVILRQTDICKDVLYIVKGIAASEYVVDGKAVISRFFQPGDICTNVISAVAARPDCDNMISLTTLQAISIPLDIWLEYYHEPSVIGRFIREKVLKIIVEDKTIVSSKTLLSSEELDRFIREAYPEIIRLVPSKYIAQFMGITPEAYSRLLKRTQKKS